MDNEEAATFLAEDRERELVIDNLRQENRRLLLAQENQEMDLMRMANMGSAMRENLGLQVETMTRIQQTAVGDVDGYLSTRVAWVQAKATEMKEHVDCLKSEIARIKQLEVYKSSTEAAGAVAAPATNPTADQKEGEKNGDAE